MTLKGYTLFTPGDETDLLVLASSPEEAASLLGGEFRGPTERDEEIWEVVFPASLFSPPRLGSEDERRKDGMWFYRIKSTLGEDAELLLALENGAELVMWLQEYPVVSSVPLGVPD
ncbi:MAG: hypothetical protein Q8P12_06120 [bacterium]|nr:hypothetical protein [bacterium]